MSTPHSATPSNQRLLPAVSTGSLSGFASAAADYALPFLLIVYLSLKGGGYDSIIYSEVGIAAWWITLAAVAAGVLPRKRLPVIAWVGLGALLAMAVWTAIGIGWSESAERSTAELGRIAAYIGVFALALVAQGPDSLRRMVGGTAAGIGLIGLLALTSRLEPDWFPANETVAFLDGGQSRLNYPLNYWNGLAALMAIGIPLLLGVAVTARSVLARAIAGGFVPILALVAYYTLSRGGAVAIAVSLIAFVALSPSRLRMLPVLAVAAAGSALLIGAATQRSDLENNLANAAAQTQADQMIAVALVVCIGVAFLIAAIGLAAKAGIGPRPQLSRQSSAIALIVSGIAAVLIAVAAGLPGAISDGWEDFKANPDAGDDPERLLSLSGNGRYQLWQAAVEANETAPLTGIGPGTYEYWWAREGSNSAFVRDAHSLYLETLAELGIVGLLILLVAIGLPLAAAAMLALRGSRRDRQLAAAAGAAMVAFAVSAVADWSWEIPVLPISFLLLAAAVLAAAGRGRGSSGEAGRASLAVPLRAGAAVLALAAIVAVAIPYGKTSSLRESQAEANARALDPALERAREGGNIQPYAASPDLQEALVLELDGDLQGAVAAARAATADESTNWRTWFVLSRLEARTGDAEASVAAYEEARSLNPRSTLFTGG